MGLFNFFNTQRSKRSIDKEQIDIPKELFLEEQDTQKQIPGYDSNGDTNGIEAIYSFLQADYESKGYNDSLTSPDDSYKSDNIKLIKMDLQILVQKVNTYYEDLLRGLDFHISSRGRAGLIDLVDKLKSQKEIIKEHMSKVKQIENEIENNNGMTQRVLLSYQRGFMRGLSALTQSEILTQKL